MVRDPDGVAALKLRQFDSGRWDVYGPEMALTGQVRLRDGSIEWRETRTGDWSSASLDGDVWEMPESVRLEALQDGWSVFDAQNQSLGYLRRVETGWERRTSYDGKPIWRVHDEALVADGSREQHSVVGEYPGHGVMIALTFDDLPLIARVALGRFVESDVATDAVARVGRQADRREPIVESADAGFGADASSSRSDARFGGRDAARGDDDDVDEEALDAAP
jgi:hypothetical protein